MSILPFISQIGPRIAIPTIFIGPKVATMTDPIAIAQTMAFSMLTVTAVLIFSKEFFC